MLVEPGTAELIRVHDPGARLVPRGRIEIKGKGRLMTWFLEGRTA
jgi:hypothetical protein